MQRAWRTELIGEGGDAEWQLRGCVLGAVAEVGESSGGLELDLIMIVVEQL